MNRLILAAALAAGCALATSAPALAAAKNYDCSKPGNANKAVCKGAAKSAAAASKPAPAAAKSAPAKAAATAPKPHATKVSSTTSTKTVTEKKYDCSKAGNANKAVCKSARAGGPSRSRRGRRSPPPRANMVAANRPQCQRLPSMPKLSASSSHVASKPVAQTESRQHRRQRRSELRRVRRQRHGARRLQPRLSVEDHKPSGSDGLQ